MSRMLRGAVFAGAVIGSVAAGQLSAQAQTRPLITTLGPGFPKTEIFIGNSFFSCNA